MSVVQLDHVMVVIAGMIVGAMCFGGFPDAVSSFKEEMERNGAWTKQVGKQTVEYVLEGVENAYNDFYTKAHPTVADLDFLIGQEYHMYSIIHKETSLRTDSQLVKFLIEDLDFHLVVLGNALAAADCTAAVSEARTSLAGPYNYRSQAYSLSKVKKKCA